MQGQCALVESHPLARPLLPLLESALLECALSSPLLSNMFALTQSLLEHVRNGGEAWMLLFSDLTRNPLTTIAPRCLRFMRLTGLSVPIVHRNLQGHPFSPLNS
jgi:hypothetical protein